jgi:hypothetical protein
MLSRVSSAVALAARVTLARLGQRVDKVRRETVTSVAVLLGLRCLLSAVGGLVSIIWPRAGARTSPEGMTYRADMGLLVNVGHTPTVLFGPGDVRVAHRPDEYVPLRELETAVRALPLMALHFCGYGA